MMQLAAAMHNNLRNRYGKPIVCTTKLILIFDRDLLIPPFISLNAMFMCFNFIGIELQM